MTDQPTMKFDWSLVTRGVNPRTSKHRRRLSRHAWAAKVGVTTEQGKATLNLPARTRRGAERLRRKAERACR